MILSVFLLAIARVDGFSCPANNYGNVCGGVEGPYGIKVSPSSTMLMTQFNTYKADTPGPYLRSETNQWDRYYNYNSSNDDSFVM